MTYGIGTGLKTDKHQGDFWSQYGVKSQDIYTSIFEQFKGKERKVFQGKLGGAYKKEKVKVLVKQIAAENALLAHEDKMREAEIQMYKYIDDAQKLWK